MKHGESYQGLTVRVDTTVSTVRASPLLRRLVDLDVLDDQVAGVQALGVGIGLSILEQREQELSGLDGPTGLADAELLAFIPQPPSVFMSYASSHMACDVVYRYVPWAVRPVLPAYLLMGTASAWFLTFSR